MPVTLQGMTWTIQSVADTLRTNDVLLERALYRLFNSELRYQPVILVNSLSPYAPLFTNDGLTVPFGERLTPEQRNNIRTQKLRSISIWIFRYLTRQPGAAVHDEV